MGLGSASALDTIVHEGLHATLGRFFPAAVVIQQAAITRRPNGEQVETWGTFLSGLYGNLARTTKDGGERRGETNTTAMAVLALNLRGHYPTITIEHRALVTIGGTATVYNITAVVHDSLSESTRLELERVDH